MKLSSIASALVLLAAVWIRCRSPVKVSCFAVVYTLLSVYIIVLAVMSPTPPLNDSTAGAVLVVSAVDVGDLYFRFVMGLPVSEVGFLCCCEAVGYGS